MKIKGKRAVRLIFTVWKMLRARNLTIFESKHSKNAVPTKPHKSFNPDFMHYILTPLATSEKVLRGLFFIHG